VVRLLKIVGRSAATCDATRGETISPVFAPLERPGLHRRKNPRRAVTAGFGSPSPGRNSMKL
jgi:hypothetical protein